MFHNLYSDKETSALWQCQFYSNYLPKKQTYLKIFTFLNGIKLHNNSTQLQCTVISLVWDDEEWWNEWAIINHDNKYSHFLVAKDSLPPNDPPNGRAKTFIAQFLEILNFELCRQSSLFDKVHNSVVVCHLSCMLRIQTQSKQSAQKITVQFYKAEWSKILAGRILQLYFARLAYTKSK